MAFGLNIMSDVVKDFLYIGVLFKKYVIWALKRSLIDLSIVLDFKLITTKLQRPLISFPF